MQGNLKVESGGKYLNCYLGINPINSRKQILGTNYGLRMFEQPCARGLIWPSEKVGLALFRKVPGYKTGVDITKKKKG